MLLDTHVWLWHGTGNATRLGPRARKQIDRAARHGSLVISVASMFEIAGLVVAGRLRLAVSAEAWMRKSLEIGRIQVAEITSAIAIDAGNIPTTAIPDPLDRLLVATASTLGVPIATRDAAIVEYIASAGVGRVLDVVR